MSGLLRNPIKEKSEPPKAHMILSLYPRRLLQLHRAAHEPPYDCNHKRVFASF